MESVCCSKHLLSKAFDKRSDKILLNPHKLSRTYNLNGPLKTGSTKPTGNCRLQISTCLNRLFLLKRNNIFIISMANLKMGKQVLICQPTLPQFIVPAGIRIDPFFTFKTMGNILSFNCWLLCHTKYRWR